jgi:hypothetical protein
MYVEREHVIDLNLKSLFHTHTHTNSGKGSNGKHFIWFFITVPNKVKKKCFK